jgi:short subunit fatty acids transporter
LQLDDRQSAGDFSTLDIIRDVGAGLSRFSERWFPESWVICTFLTSAALLLAVFGADIGVGEAVLTC